MRFCVSISYISYGSLNTIFIIFVVEGVELSKLIHHKYNISFNYIILQLLIEDFLMRY